MFQVKIKICMFFFLLHSIHPRDKQSVAYRLYLGALAVAYGKDNLTFQGPYPQEVLVDVDFKILNVTYNQNIQLHHLDSKIFEVRVSREVLFLSCTSWEWSAVILAAIQTSGLGLVQNSKRDCIQCS